MYFLKIIKKRIKIILIPIFILILTTLFANLSFFSTKKESTSILNSKKKKKNVILVVTDGFGFSTLSFLTIYNHYTNNSQNAFINFINKSDLALTMTHSNNNIVTDSAASATAMATGQKTNNYFVGMGPEKKELKKITQILKNKQKSIGLVTNTRVSHATPAAFYASNINRVNESAIISDLLKNDIDVLLGGGLDFFTHSDIKNPNIPFKFKPKRKFDDQIMSKLEKLNYEFVFSKDQLANSQSKKLIGLFSGSHLPYYIDQLHEKNKNIPRLDQMASKAIEILSQNPEGFFLMVESGNVDISEHDIDMGSLLHELMATNKLIEFLSNYVKQNPDTLLILTSDHETGVLSFSYFYPEKKDYKNSELNLELDISSHTNHFAPFFQKPEILKKIWKLQKMSLKKIWKLSFNKNKSNSNLLSINSKTLTKLLNQNFPIEITQEKIKEIFLLNHKDEVDIQKLLNHYNHLVKYNGGYKKIDRTYYAIIISQLITPYFGIIWSSGTHSASLVPTFVYNSENLNPKILQKQLIQNSDIFHMILNAVE